jgi:cytochrome b
MPYYQRFIIVSLNKIRLRWGISGASSDRSSRFRESRASYSKVKSRPSNKE